MKEFKIFKIGIFLTALLLMCTSVVTSFAADSAINPSIYQLDKLFGDSDSKDTGFTIETTYGIDGMAKNSIDMPISMKISNSGKDFDGKVRVIMPSGTYGYSVGSNIAYEKDVNIAAGTDKTIGITVNGVNVLTSFYIQLVDNKGKVVHEEKVLYNNVLSQSESENGYPPAIVGILSDDYNAFNYIDGVAIEKGYYIGNAKLLELTDANIPDTGNGLAICNYIIIDNYDTSKLSDAQVMAVKSWVDDGGVLIFGTGNNSDKVFARFGDDFIGGTIGKVSKQEVSLVEAYIDNGYNPYAGSENYDVDEDKEETQIQTTNTEVDPESIEPEEPTSTGTAISVDVLDIQVNGAEEVEYIVDKPIFLQKESGRGVVAVAAIDLGLEPVVSWSDNKAMVSQMLSMLGNAYTERMLDQYYTEGSYDYSIGNAVSKTADIKSPSALLYLFIFVVYIVIMGPITYIVLKKKKQRELLWIGVPIVAVIFTVIIMISSIIYRIWRPFSSEIAIVEVADNMENEYVYGALYNPYSKGYSATFNPEYSKYQAYLNDNYMSYYTSGEQEEDIGTDYKYAINEAADGITLDIQKDKAFTATNFSVEGGTVNNSDIVTSLESVGDSFQGTVTNNTSYTIKDVVVIYRGKYVIIDKLSSGEACNITTSQCELYDYSYDLIARLGRKDNNNSSLTGYRYSFWGYDTYENSEIYTKMLDDYYSYDEEADYSNNQGIVFGTLEDYKIDLIKDKKVKEFSKGFIYKTIDEKPVTMGMGGAN